MKPSIIKCKNGEKLTHFKLSIPFGELEMSSCPNGLHSLHINRSRPFPDVSIPNLWSRVQLIWQDDPKFDYEPVGQSLEYFRAYFTPDESSENGLRSPNVCWRSICTENSFSEKVMKTLLNEIGPGKRVFYSELATLVGNSKAQRAVGTVMRKNPIALIVPCHRVVRSNQTIGNYSGGVDIKEWLLEFENLYYFKS